MPPPCPCRPPSCGDGCARAARWRSACRRRRSTTSAPTASTARSPRDGTPVGRAQGATGGPGRARPEGDRPRGARRAVAVERHRLLPGVQRPVHHEGATESGWVLLDYGDVLMHVFLEDTRAYYALERLWGDAPSIPVDGA